MRKRVDDDDDDDERRMRKFQEMGECANDKVCYRMHLPSVARLKSST